MTEIRNTIIDHHTFLVHRAKHIVLTQSSTHTKAVALQGKALIHDDQAKASFAV